MSRDSRGSHFYKPTFWDGDGKEMAWSELTGWTSALTRLTRGF